MGKRQGREVRVHPVVVRLRSEVCVRGSRQESHMEEHPLVATQEVNPREVAHQEVAHQGLPLKA